MKRFWFPSADEILQKDVTMWTKMSDACLIEELKYFDKTYQNENPHEKKETFSQEIFFFFFTEEINYISWIKHDKRKCTIISTKVKTIKIDKFVFNQYVNI